MTGRRLVWPLPACCWLLAGGPRLRAEASGMLVGAPMGRASAGLASAYPQQLACTAPAPCNASASVRADGTIDYTSYQVPVRRRGQTRPPGSAQAGPPQEDCTAHICAQPLLAADSFCGAAVDYAARLENATDASGEVEAPSRLCPRGGGAAACPAGLLSGGAPRRRRTTTRAACSTTGTSCCC